MTEGLILGVTVTVAVLVWVWRARWALSREQGRLESLGRIDARRFHG